MDKQYKDIEHLVKDAGLDNPSPDFLKNVMDQVEVSNISAPVIYSPLISKKSWLVIGLISLVLLCIVPFLSNTKIDFIQNIDFSFFQILKIQNLFSGFTFHVSTIYGVLFLALLFFIQIPILKKRIDKSFS
ncbi:hypothetical protein D1816_24145 [Aquimarina sp. AD10]|uniref:Uncharacterized protein n=1 Tax=Aquimarina aggregata TaxID=1642818 RepID=A0A163A9I8_9FLAO|nr:MULTISPECIES: hypothetical protein [Aquimarina]AXT63299.1 hypothetical protein D1816_24145 [Aquimarina sp. AD10]KZS40369.1 hypothetical protein AWE51_05275 [Aquimarina aggregata]RKN00688.1 hypothetical protein D7033_07550 [Aquimarina sp. AD10]